MVLSSETAKSLEKSNGHIAFYQMPYSGVRELYAFTDDAGVVQSLCSAPISNVIDLDMGVRCGQFECYPAQADRRKADIRQMSTVFVGAE